MFNKVINFKFIVYIFTFLLNDINFIWNDKSIHTHHVHIKDYMRDHGSIGLPLGMGFIDGFFRLLCVFGL